MESPRDRHFVFDVGLLVGLLLHAAIGRVVSIKENQVSKTDLSRTTRDDLRGAINSKRRSGRFTSIAHRADVATQPEPVVDPVTEPADDAPVEPVTSNAFLRQLTGRA